LPSYIENTLDLLRHLEELEFEDLPKEAIPVTIDVVGFYSNIPQGQAQKFMKDALNTRPQQKKNQVSTQFAQKNIYKKFWKRYIDDILLIWTGTEEELKAFLEFLNSLHPTIKFTHDYDFTTKSVNFLDTKITIKDGNISTDLFQKETHSDQYLLPTSTHPPHCTKNSPYSLAYKLKRICSEEDSFEKRLEELNAVLLK